MKKRAKLFYCLVKLANFVQKIIKNKKWQQTLSTLFWVILIVGLLRLSGLLQPFEWAVLDYYFRSRPIEPIDPRIVVVEISEQDISRLKEYPLSDKVLAELLEKIRDAKPLAVGLDLYRDYPVPRSGGEGYEKLSEIFRTTPNLVGIQKVLGEANNPPIPGPPALVESEVGFVASNDVVIDSDRVLRRALLYPSTIREEMIPSLGLVLAGLYLNEKGSNATWSDDGFTLKFASVKLTRFLPNHGGYIRTNNAGYQMFLNYRTPPKNFQKFSIFEILDGKIKPEKLQNKIVFIGQTSTSSKDIFYTPYTALLNNSLEDNNDENRSEDNVYGVYVQANLTSQIISSVLDNRPLIKTWSDIQEFIWISLWPLISIILIGRFYQKKIIKVENSSPIYWLLIVTILISTVLGVLVGIITFLAFIREAYWLPVVPPLIGLFCSSILGAQAIYIWKLKESNTELRAAKQKLAKSNETLEQKVAERTQELEERTQELEDTVEILEETKKKLVFENQVLKKSESSDTKYYYLGGTVPLDSPAYVVRYADLYLYEALREGEYCYVFNARTMGKSSLFVRMTSRLKAEGFKCATVDLSKIVSSDLTLKQWYLGLIDQLSYSFQLTDKFDPIEWWFKYQSLSPKQRFCKFFAEILLSKISEKIVIFFDEIDNILSLNFNTDDFFILIRSFYNSRPNSPDFSRLTFVFLGVASPFTLIQNKVNTPFNIGRAIALEPFELHDVAPLTKGLSDKCANPQRVLKEILAWTGGQPFLTQKLCFMISKSQNYISKSSESSLVENLVKLEIIDNWEFKDAPQHLKTIRDRLLSPQSSTEELLKLYQQLLNGEEIIASESSPLHMELLLTGLVYKKQGKIKIYNRIYQTIFNLDWVSEQLGPSEAAEG